MENLRASVNLLSLQTKGSGRNSNLWKYASGVLGPQDADHWYEKHATLFTHPRFTDALGALGDITQIMPPMVDDNTVWAHTHPNWGQSFGVYIVRRGGEIIYEGRSEEEVKRLLGMKSAL